MEIGNSYVVPNSTVGKANNVAPKNTEYQTNVIAESENDSFVSSKQLAKEAVSQPKTFGQKMKDYAENFKMEHNIGGTVVETYDNGKPKKVMFGEKACIEYDKFGDKTKTDTEGNIRKYTEVDGKSYLKNEKLIDGSEKSYEYLNGKQMVLEEFTTDGEYARYYNDYSPAVEPWSYSSYGNLEKNKGKDEEWTTKTLIKGSLKDATKLKDGALQFENGSIRLSDGTVKVGDSIYAPNGDIYNKDHIIHENGRSYYDGNWSDRPIIRREYANQNKRFETVCE